MYWEPPFLILLSRLCVLSAPFPFNSPSSSVNSPYSTPSSRCTECPLFDDEEDDLTPDEMEALVNLPDFDDMVQHQPNIPDFDDLVQPAKTKI